MLHRITSILTVSVSGFLFVEMSGTDLPTPLRILAGIAGGFAIFDFVVGYSARADEHRSLRRKYCELEADMVVADENDVDQWKIFQSRRIRIEIDEPPMYRALDLLCRNELMAAHGYVRSCEKDAGLFGKVRWWQLMTAHIWRWPNIGTQAACPGNKDS